jgi:hypothetical protein
MLVSSVRKKPGLARRLALPAVPAFPTFSAVLAEGLVWLAGDLS